jgi:hypothetical protein
MIVIKFPIISVANRTLPDSLSGRVWLTTESLLLPNLNLQCSKALSAVKQQTDSSTDGGWLPTGSL